MHQQYPRLVLGMKLKQLRLKHELSLKELAERTDLSVSYLNEIEKGKKYPKPEKLVTLASALQSSFDELVSTKLDKELNPLGAVLDSALIQKFPLDLFGITPQDVVQLLSQAPREAGALVRTIVDITRNYDMGIEKFFHAALRSYQELHQNHFPDIELEAQSFRRRVGQLHSWHACATALKELVGADVEELPTDRPEFARLRSVWIPGGQPKLMLNARLLDNQKAFVIAREIGYRVLMLKERALVSPPQDVQTFDQVLNDFKASYFAGALLLDRQALADSMRDFFARPTWSAAGFMDLMHHFHATPEMFFYRLSQVLPAECGLPRVHFLRFTANKQQYRISKELNMSSVRLPSGIGLNEHFCRRWLSVQILDQLGVSGQSEAADIQISQFLGKPTKFLCIAVARPLALQPRTLSSVTIGFQLDAQTKRKIAFHRDPEIPHRELGQTCERCPLDTQSCHLRAAPRDLYERDEERARMRQTLMDFIDQQRHGS